MQARILKGAALVGLLVSVSGTTWPWQQWPGPSRCLGGCAPSYVEVTMDPLQVKLTGPNTARVSFQGIEEATAAISVYHEYEITYRLDREVGPDQWSSAIPGHPDNTSYEVLQDPNDPCYPGEIDCSWYFHIEVGWDGVPLQRGENTFRATVRRHYLGQNGYIPDLYEYYYVTYWH